MSGDGLRSDPAALPSDELICLPFLDTGSDEQRRAATEELMRRGYPPRLIVMLRRVAEAGLWYQRIAWEWGSLGAFDVLLGYGVILVVASPFPAVFFPRVAAALFITGLLAIAVAAAGLRWRR